VQENLESRRRQYELVEWALERGWSREATVVIDEDQGKSSAKAKTRTGFARLLAAVGEELRRSVAAYLSSHVVTYRRSNAREQRSSLAEVISGQAGLEMGYNPNDCVEIRWAAPEGSEEMSSFSRRAPEEQRARMHSYRSWFHNRPRSSRR
jgi:hypothetical protein